MSFYFYDLETSGINARTSRIMQFGGIRTSKDLEIEDEWMVHVKMTDEILPEPDAVLLTGITPQKTLEEGVSEAEFLKEFSRRALKRNTTILGYNNIRFDDEFMRYTLWRNFYDAYEWQWRDGRSRWDLLDVMRMTRALRPEGIEWPMDGGKPTNRLELLTKANNIDHGAHDALGDARATLELARLVRKHNPKLFEFLYNARTKEGVNKVISPKNPKPFIYSSGRYSSDFEKTTAAVVLAPHPSNGNGYLVYDLRVDPSEYLDWTTQQMANRIFMSYKDRKESGLASFPVKILQINKAPAVAPMGVLDDAAQKRIQLNIQDVESNLKKLSQSTEFIKNIARVWAGDKKQFKSANDPDVQLYDGFLDEDDREQMRFVRGLDDEKRSQLQSPFTDKRLNALWPRYLARNFPQNLSEEQKKEWEDFRIQRLTTGVSGSMTFQRYFARLQQIAQRQKLSDQDQFLLEELQLYGESIAPQLDAEEV